MQPKMGQIDIDYQVLLDAFFRFQTKPPLTRHGDIYYEGKEYEVKLLSKKPGVLSDELKEALGMPSTDSSAPPLPPPWLFKMQQYGPPPAYPHLAIPGVNAPLPPGVEEGFGPGQWGRVPVDPYGRPLYSAGFQDPFHEQAVSLREVRH